MAAGAIATPGLAVVRHLQLGGPKSVREIDDQCYSIPRSDVLCHDIENDKCGLGTGH